MAEKLDCFGGSDQSNTLICQQNDEKMGLILGSERCFCYGNEPFKKGFVKYQGICSKLSGVLGKLPTYAIKHSNLVQSGSVDEQSWKIL